MSESLINASFASFERSLSSLTPFINSSFAAAASIKFSMSLSCWASLTMESRMSLGLFALTDAARSVVSLFRSAAMKMRARLGESCPPHKVLVVV